MSVSDEYLMYVVDQLRQFGPVTTKRMFGGAWIYCDGLFFALVAEDVLYFKVDDTNRGDYEAAGSQPFKPFDDKPLEIGYYDVPADVLESPEQLCQWAQKAYVVAQRAKKAKKKKKSKKTRLKRTKKK